MLKLLLKFIPFQAIQSKPIKITSCLFNASQNKQKKSHGDDF